MKGTEWTNANIPDKCPICHKTWCMEYQVNDKEEVIKERCQHGCYVYNFITKKREI